MAERLGLLDALNAWAPDGDFGTEVLAATGSGPLDGVRVVVKDLVHIQGRRTVAGTPAGLTAPVAAASAVVIDRLRAAGATITGKSATDELAMGMFGVNTHFGTPANAAAPDRVPGGSSSGSATLVAAGEAELGLGTDTGGSIRVPGAFQGLVALRPTHGRIPLDGVVPMAPGFDTCGLLARAPELIGAAFAALRDAPATGDRPATSLTRVVLLRDLVDLASPPMAALTRLTARRWATTLGLPLVEVGLVEAGAGLPENLLEIFWPLMSRQLWQSNGAWVTTERPTLGEGIEERIRAAAGVTDAEVAEAERSRATLRARLAEVLDGAVAVLPTTRDAAPLRTSTHAELMAWRDANLALVVPGSLTGAPQLTLPVGTLTDAVAGTDAPVGVSLLGLPGDDELLVALGAILTAAAPGAHA